jgi:hypothetical protein
MMSSSDLFSKSSKVEDFCLRENLSKIIFFKYFDGFEDALCVLNSGEIFRAKSVGSSRTGIFRAFLFFVMNKSFVDQNECILGENGQLKTGEVEIIDMSSEDGMDKKLHHETLRSSGGPDFVAIGNPVLDWAIICQVPAHNQAIFSSVFEDIDAYDLVHEIIKKARRSKAMKRKQGL